MNSKNKVSIILILIATVLIIGIGGYLIGKKQGQAESEATTQSTTEKITEAASEEKTEEATEGEATEEKTTEAKSEEKKEEKDGDDKGDGAIYVKVTSNSPWEKDGGYGFQCDVMIKNDSSEEYDDWEIQITGFKDAEIENLWNAEYEIVDDVLKLKPVDFNKHIGAKSENKDIGMIVNVKSKDATKNIAKGGTLIVDGKVVAEADAAEKIREEKKKEREAKREPRPVEEGTPLDNHGALSVKGTDIVDKNGEKYQLRGVSTHGIAWFPDYINKDAFQTLRDDWGANMIRLAMYTDEGGGYCTDGDKDKLKGLVSDGVDYATELGMYVIIDWHVLHDLDPNKNIDEAKLFFEEMSSKYEDQDNVIYEICNEPNGSTTWDDIKKYAEVIIPIIRKNDKDAIIIVGTPTWSQDVDTVIPDPITGQENIMYAVHFYAATHKENIRNKAKDALDAGIPVFISEFSICDASGNGGIDYDSADEWMEFINDNNLSYSSWSLCNKNETSALIAPECSKTSGWTDDELSETGQWLKDTISSK